MKFFPSNRSELIWLVLGLMGVGVLAFLAYQIYLLQQENLRLSNELNALKEQQISTAKSLLDTVTVLDENLSLTKSEQDKLRSVLSSEQERVRTQETQLQNISSTVGTLEKLTYTDEELLQKYSKIYFLNENYVPARLSRINQKYTYGGKDDMQIHTSVLPFLEKLLNANTDKDFDLIIISAYRSFGTQEDLKTSYVFTYGAGTANQFSADQGYSEHQLGTTVDFTTIRTGGDFSSFKDTSDYKWLLDNAHRFGFTLSYPEGNSYYEFEPWHWRFVGVELATKLYNQSKHFYDLDQREIDTHLATIFD